MCNNTYIEIIKNGERVDWYGIEVPKDLLTKLVVTWSSGLKKEIDKLEYSLSDLRGSSLEKRKGYIEGLVFNLQNAPYSLNGDAFLKKKECVELEIEQEKTNKKKKKTTKTNKSSRNTKNSDLIFGKTKQNKI